MAKGEFLRSMHDITFRVLLALSLRQMHTTVLAHVLPLKYMQAYLHGIPLIAAQPMHFMVPLDSGSFHTNRGQAGLCKCAEDEGAHVLPVQRCKILAPKYSNECTETFSALVAMARTKRC